jgi:hypothetical protein
MEEKIEVGDIIHLLVGDPQADIEVEVVALNQETGMPAKLRAVTPSEMLTQYGFFKEGDQYFHSEREICHN